jgi:hypothetical protein
VLKLVLHRSVLPLLLSRSCRSVDCFGAALLLGLLLLSASLSGAWLLEEQLYLLPQVSGIGGGSDALAVCCCWELGAVCNGCGR